MCRSRGRRYTKAIKVERDREAATSRCRRDHYATTTPAFLKWEINT
jgi:hypothetical protein